MDNVTSFGTMKGKMQFLLLQIMLLDHSPSNSKTLPWKGGNSQWQNDGNIVTAEIFRRKGVKRKIFGNNIVQVIGKEEKKEGSRNIMMKGKGDVWLVGTRGEE